MTAVESGKRALELLGKVFHLLLVVSVIFKSLSVIFDLAFFYMRIYGVSCSLVSVVS